jgi:AraC-like DNA-binding protein
MPFRSSLLSNYPTYLTNNPELVRERLCRDFDANSFEAGNGTGFAAQANHLHVGGLGLTYCGYASDVSIGFNEASFVRQIFNIDGVGQYSASSRSGEITPGSWSPILPAGAPLNLDFKSGYQHLVLRIEVDALSRNLSALLGQELGAKLQFTETPAYGPAMSSLRRRVFVFASDFNERGAFFSGLAAAEIERMMIMNFLMCHRHNYTHLLLRQPLPATSSAVRVVEEFIEANWDKPIDVPAMAVVANVSARSLFRQFRRDRGYSPADFAKRIRLLRARELLEQASAETSVTQVSLKCGFQNPGHFARDFRLAFGELPSEALKRAAGRLSL